MEPTEHTHPEPAAPDDDTARSLQEAEEMLEILKQRYQQIQAAKAQQPELEQRLQDLKTELDSVKQQLAQTWEDLESQLITWRDNAELFWQFLRFAGIGFGAALLLKHFVK